MHTVRSQDEILGWRVVCASIMCLAPSHYTLQPSTILLLLTSSSFLKVWTALRDQQGVDS